MGEVRRRRRRAGDGGCRRDRKTQIFYSFDGFIVRANKRFRIMIINLVYRLARVALAIHSFANTINCGVNVTVLGMFADAI